MRTQTQKPFGHVAKGRYDLSEKMIREHLRISLPKPHDLYIQKTLEQPVQKRLRIAATTRFPCLIEALAEDEHCDVKKIARMRHYWRFITQNRHLLHMSHRERQKFVSNESLENLLVFLIEETDHAVLRTVFHNPAISVGTLSTYRHHLLQRPRSSMDSRLLIMLDQTMTIKRERIIKVADIWREDNDPAQLLSRLLPSLADKDPIVAQSAVNRIETIPEEALRAWLSGENEDPRFDYLLLWKILKVLQKHFAVSSQTANSISWHQFFIDCQQHLLEKSAGSIEQPAALLTLVWAHCDSNDNLRSIAESKFALADVLNLIADDSSPINLAAAVISRLRYHPNFQLRPKLETISLKLAERSRIELEELEGSVNASFEVLDEWESKLAIGEDSSTQARISPLIYLRDMLRHIRKLPHGISNARDLQTSSQQHSKFNMMWRITLGQYVSRLRELDKTVLRLWVDALPAGDKKEAFLVDQKKVIAQLEASYKEDVQCELQISCSTCMKRSCSAERFLRQTEFFSGELINHLKEV